MFVPYQILVLQKHCQLIFEASVIEKIFQIFFVWLDTLLFPSQYAFQRKLLHFNFAVCQKAEKRIVDVCASVENLRVAELRENTEQGFSVR